MRLQLNWNSYPNCYLNHNQNHNPYQYQLNHIEKPVRIKLLAFLGVRKIEFGSWPYVEGSQCHTDTVQFNVPWP
jgi:hypothetical protein